MIGIMGGFDCPACDEIFICDDGSEWEKYAAHLRDHIKKLMELSNIRGTCCVCYELVFEPDGTVGKFDPEQPMDLTEVDEYGDVCHLGCSGELMDETITSVPGFDEVTRD